MRRPLVIIAIAVSLIAAILGYAVIAGEDPDVESTLARSEPTEAPEAPPPAPTATATPPAEAEPQPTSANEPGDVVHVDPANEPVGEPSESVSGPLPPAEAHPPYSTSNEPGDVTEEDHGDHHWTDRSLVFVDYTGDRFASSLARAAKVWNDVGARVHVFVVDGGEIRYDCGTSSTTGDTIPVCLAPSTVDYAGIASWGFDSNGHTVRGAINIAEDLSLSQADRTVAHEVGHIIEFRHGGGCVMEQTPDAPDCTVPSSSDKTELTSVYDHGGEGDANDVAGCKKHHGDIHAYAQAAVNLGVSVSSINGLNDQLHANGCTGTTTSSSTASDLTKCKALHFSLHDNDEEAFRRGVSLASLVALNDQLHAKGCTG